MSFGIYLRWINYLGGWDSWLFQGYQDLGVNITEAQETKRDIFNIWDNDFTEGTTQSDYIRVQSQSTRVVRSQFLTEAESDAIKWIKQSVKVQSINQTLACAEQNRITVLVDKNAFTIRTTERKLRTISFNLRFTNDELTQTQ